MITIHGAKTFQQIMPGSGSPDTAANFYFRLDWAPQNISLQTSRPRPAWAAFDSRGVAYPIQANGRRASISKPATAGTIDVADGGDLKTIWFVSATIQVRSSGSIDARNPNWSSIQARLRNDLGSPAYPFTQLGLVQFDIGAQTMGLALSGRRYGGEVEIVGTVSPGEIRNTGLRFFLARRIAAVSEQSLDVRNQTIPPNVPNRVGRAAQMNKVAGSNDTSTGQSGALTADARLYDYDLPGSVMGPGNLVGDRHIIDVSYEQVVAIGVPPPSLAVNPWPRITTEGLAVSPVARWRANLTATMTRAASSTRGVAFTLTGSVG